MCRHTQIRCIPPNQTQCFRALLHNVWHVEACRHTQMRCIPPNQTQCCRALQHHMSLTCTRMADVPRSDVPTWIKPSASEPYYTIWVWHVDTYIWTQVQCTPSPNNPSATTLLLHHMSLTCGCIHMNPGSDVPPPQSNPVLQNPATLCLFHMWMNTYVTRSHVPMPH